MSDSHKTLTEQVKEAEREKYLAETRKVNKEIEILDSNINRPKKSKWNLIWKNLLNYLATFGVLAAFIGFYIQYGVIPYITRDSIKNEITRLKQEKLQQLLSYHLDSLNRSLISKDVLLTIRQQKVIEDSIKYDGLFRSFNISNKKNILLSNALKEKRTLVDKANDSLILIRKQLKPIVLEVDSLRQVAQLVYLISRFGQCRITMTFYCNNKVVWPPPMNVKLKLNGTSLSRGADEHIGTVFIMPPGNYTILLKDKIYKLVDDQINLPTQDEIDTKIRLEKK